MTTPPAPGSYLCPRCGTPRAIGMLGPCPADGCDAPPLFVPTGGPDDGHTFRITAATRMSSAVLGDAHHTDAPAFFPTAFTTDVRAWDLPAALRTAAGIPLVEWTHTEVDATGVPRWRLRDHDNPPDPGVVRDVPALRGFVGLPPDAVRTVAVARWVQHVGVAMIFAVCVAIVVASFVTAR